MSGDVATLEQEKELGFNEVPDIRPVIDLLENKLVSTEDVNEALGESHGIIFIPDAGIRTFEDFNDKAKELSHFKNFSISEMLLVYNVLKKFKDYKAVGYYLSRLRTVFAPVVKFSEDLSYSDYYNESFLRGEYIEAREAFMKDMTYANRLELIKLIDKLILTNPQNPEYFEEKLGIMFVYSRSKSYKGDINLENGLAEEKSFILDKDLGMMFLSGTSKNQNPKFFSRSILRIVELKKQYVGIITDSDISAVQECIDSLNPDLFELANKRFPGRFSKSQLQRKQDEAVKSSAASVASKVRAEIQSSVFEDVFEGERLSSMEDVLKSKPLSMNTILGKSEEIDIRYGFEKIKFSEPLPIGVDFSRFGLNNQIDLANMSKEIRDKILYTPYTRLNGAEHGFQGRLLMSLEIEEIENLIEKLKMESHPNAYRFETWLTLKKIYRVLGLCSPKGLYKLFINEYKRHLSYYPALTLAWTSVMLFSLSITLSITIGSSWIGRLYFNQFLK